MKMEMSLATWTLWQWCLVWVVSWAILLLLVSLPRWMGALRAHSFGEEETFPFLIALGRAFLIFVAWWGGRFITGLKFPSGAMHWVGTVILLFIFVALMAKVLGHIGSRDFSGGRLVKEFVAVVVGVILLLLIARSL